MNKIIEKLRHLFIAHEGNNFRPHAFRHKWLSFYTLSLILSHYLMFGFMTVGVSVNDPQKFSNDIVSYTNQKRQENGENSLVQNDALTKAAKDKLDDMLEKNYWDHKAPDGTEAWTFIDNEGYSYTLAGENLAKGFENPTKTVDAWMDSKTHRENLLNEKYTDIGVATVNGKINDQETTITVQLFGTKANQTLAKNEKTLVMGEQTLKPSVSLKNLMRSSNLPYFSLWLIILTFMILDTRMLKKLGLHKNRYHKFQIRQLLVLNVALFILLLVGVSHIA